MTFGGNHRGEQRDSPGDDKGNVTSAGLEPSQRGSNEHDESSNCIDLVLSGGVLWWLG